MQVVHHLDHIMMWIVDTTDDASRLLRVRSAHSAPPLFIRFYPNGRHILSTGQDRAFRLFSVIQDQQSREPFSMSCDKKSKETQTKGRRNKPKTCDCI
ncbi:hypothetical protein QVD17_18771 [Tagetes erecta]|uniref:Uncharacterized protein n=1 Tax=Tagetes erecta TaxID=13708 RepID=A0AAD8NVZ8_TARER|nr:hypothetical protein QVD17_18771 [Tagetes erecta]